MNIHKAYRHTIMDGRVVIFAPSFTEYEGTFGGKSYKPFGKFVISVSRNRITVEQFSISSLSSIGEDVEYIIKGFKQVLHIAHDQFLYLQKTNGRPKDNWDGSPKRIKIHLKT